MADVPGIPLAQTAEPPAGASSCHFSPFLLFFASALRVRLRGRAEGLAALGFGGGILAAGGGILSSVGLALADVPSKLDPSAAQALNVLSNDVFLPFTIGFTAFMIGNGLAVVRGRPACLGRLGGVRDRRSGPDPGRVRGLLRRAGLVGAGGGVPLPRGDHPAGPAAPAAGVPPSAPGA